MEPRDSDTPDARWVRTVLTRWLAPAVAGLAIIVLANALLVRVWRGPDTPETTPIFSPSAAGALDSAGDDEPRVTGPGPAAVRCASPPVPGTASGAAATCPDCDSPPAIAAEPRACAGPLRSTAADHGR